MWHSDELAQRTIYLLSPLLYDTNEKVKQLTGTIWLFLLMAVTSTILIYNKQTKQVPGARSLNDSFSVAWKESLNESLLTVEHSIIKTLTFKENNTLLIWKLHFISRVGSGEG